MTIEEFLTKVSLLKDAIAMTRERLKESEIILITLGALGKGCESFVTSITTIYDLGMTFSSLCELLMDQEMRMQRNHSILSTYGSANVASKFTPKSGDQSGKSSDLNCQIYGRKSHSTLNCYNQLNLSKYPPAHSRELSASSPTGNN